MKHLQQPGQQPPGQQQQQQQQCNKHHIHFTHHAATCSSVVQVAAAFDELPASQGWLSAVSQKLCEGEPAAQAALQQYLQCAETAADRYAAADVYLGCDISL